MGPNAERDVLLQEAAKQWKTKGRHGEPDLACVRDSARVLEEENPPKNLRAKLRATAAILAAVAAVVFGVEGVSPTAYLDWSRDFSRVADWELRTNPGTAATYTVEATAYASVAIDAFGQPPDLHYFVNLRARSAPRTLHGYEEMHITVRGDGAIRALRVYPRADTEERWRSPEIPLTEEWVEHTIPLTAFEHQRGGRLRWVTVPWEEPGQIDRLQIKFGYNVNPLGATGTGEVDHVSFH